MSPTSTYKLLCVASILIVMSQIMYVRVFKDRACETLHIHHMLAQNGVKST